MLYLLQQTHLQDTITFNGAPGDRLDLTDPTLSTDLKSNGGLVIESTELAVDLGQII